MSALLSFLVALLLAALGHGPTPAPTPVHGVTVTAPAPATVAPPAVLARPAPRPAPRPATPPPAAPVTVAGCRAGETWDPADRVCVAGVGEPNVGQQVDCPGGGVGTIEADGRVSGCR